MTIGMFDATFRNVDIFQRKKSEIHVNSKKTHSEGVYYITIFGKISRDNTTKSKQRELNVNKHCSLLHSTLFIVAGLS